MNCAASMKRTPAASAALHAEGEQPRGARRAADRAHLARDQRVLRMVRQARVVDPADARMRRAGMRATASAFAQCRSMRSVQRLDALQDLPGARRRQRRAVDAQRLHARPHREAEVAEGLEELARRGSPATARSCRGTCRCPTGSGRSRPSRRRASCRGRRGTWSPSGRRCRRRSGSGCRGTATARCCRRSAARRARARPRRPRRCRAPRRLGLPRLSANTARVFGRIAAANASGSRGVDEGRLDAEPARG